MSRNSTLRDTAGTGSGITWEWRDGEWVPNASPRPRAGPLTRLAAWLAAGTAGAFMLAIGGMILLAAAIAAFPLALWIRWRTRAGLR